MKSIVTANLTVRMHSNVADRQRQRDLFTIMNCDSGWNTISRVDLPNEMKLLLLPIFLIRLNRKTPHY